MSERNFMALLQAKFDEGKFVCVGLDSDVSKLPEAAKKRVGYNHSISIEKGSYKFTEQMAFNTEIIQATKDLVCAFKPNAAFYEAQGGEGIRTLEATIRYIHEWAPDVPVILDAKRADIGNTNDGYVKFAFDICEADAITVHPTLGMEAMKPFLDRADKGVIVLCRTSNPGAGEFQDLQVKVKGYQLATELGIGSAVTYYLNGGEDSPHVPQWEYVAHSVARRWDYNGNCSVVVGATYPGELAEVRAIVGDMPILIPGIGAQGGDLGATIAAGKDSRGHGMIINNSRAIIFASSGEDFAEAARAKTQEMHDAITQTLKEQA